MRLNQIKNLTLSRNVTKFRSNSTALKLGQNDRKVKSSQTKKVREELLMLQFEKVQPIEHFNVHSATLPEPNHWTIPEAQCTAKIRIKPNLSLL